MIDQLNWFRLESSSWSSHLTSRSTLSSNSLMIFMSSFFGISRGMSKLFLGLMNQRSNSWSHGSIRQWNWLHNWWHCFRFQECLTLYPTSQRSWDHGRADVEHSMFMKIVHFVCRTWHESVLLGLSDWRALPPDRTMIAIELISHAQLHQSTEVYIVLCPNALDFHVLMRRSRSDRSNLNSLCFRGERYQSEIERLATFRALSL